MILSMYDITFLLKKLGQALTKITKQNKKLIRDFLEMSGDSYVRPQKVLPGNGMTAGLRSLPVYRAEFQTVRTYQCHHSFAHGYK